MGLYLSLRLCSFPGHPMKSMVYKVNRDNQVFFISNIPLLQTKNHASQVPNWTLHLKTDEGNILSENF